MPEPQKDKKYNYVLAASAAFYTTVREMTFSKDTISKFEKETYAPFRMCWMRPLIITPLSLEKQFQQE